MTKPIAVTIPQAAITVWCTAHGVRFEQTFEGPTTAAVTADAVGWLRDMEASHEDFRSGGFAMHRRSS